LRDPAQRLPSGVSPLPCFFHRVLSLTRPRATSAPLVRVHCRRNTGCRSGAYDATAHARPLWSSCCRPTCGRDTCSHGCSIEEVGYPRLVALVPSFFLLSHFTHTEFTS
jgi:hypothetical protein